MPDESPAPFIVIRTPAAAKAAKMDPYDAALALVGVVNGIVETATTRFYLKDKLDRAASGLVFELGRAANDVPMLRWKSYRNAQAHASDVATVIDILVHQQAAAAADLERARTMIRELIAAIAPRCAG